MRVVLISQIAPAAEGLSAMLRGLGHELGGLLCVREDADRYPELTDLLQAVPTDVDVVMPATRARIAPLLRELDPDLVLCLGFPWKIPPDALAVPKHGIVNGHPSLLPRYRGPSPVSAAIRHGETEIGFTFHYMDAELDTGNILGQAHIPLGDEHSWEELTPKLAAAVGDLLPSVLERVARGDPGEPQDETQASYHTAFEPEYAWIKASTTMDEVSRQVRAWRLQPEAVANRGALSVIDGETVRVLRVAREPTGDRRTLECADGTLWIVEMESV